MDQLLFIHLPKPILRTKLAYKETMLLVYTILGTGCCVLSVSTIYNAGHQLKVQPWMCASVYMIKGV